MSDTALVIMARCPEKGKTKTRLAASIGNEETLELYRAFLIDLTRRFAGWRYDLHWVYTPVDADFDHVITSLTGLDASLWCSFPQSGAGLGERLLHAFRITHACSFQNTVLMASDSPHISRAIIEQARQALDHSDVVLGPAEDGGYYLIAMKRPYDVFSEIPMSTPHVLQMTIEKARSQGLSVYLLETLFDIDELSDLMRLARLLQREQTLAPTTATCCSIMKELV